MRVTPEPPPTSAIRSSQTAVGVFFRPRIFAAVASSTFAAEDSTSAAQPGSTYPLAPANGLSTGTSPPGLGVMLALGPADGSATCPAR